MTMTKEDWDNPVIPKSQKWLTSSYKWYPHYTDALEIPCQHCGAAVGEDCRPMRKGSHRQQVHHCDGHLVHFSRFMFWDEAPNAARKAQYIREALGKGTAK